MSTSPRSGYWARQASISFWPTVTASSGLFPPRAASVVGASGVMPTTWHMPTAPVTAMGAMRYLSLSSFMSAGTPSSTRLRVPATPPRW